MVEDKSPEKKAKPRLDPYTNEFSTFSFKFSELDKMNKAPKTSGFNFCSNGSSPFGDTTTSVFGGRLLREPSNDPTGKIMKFYELNL